MEIRENVLDITIFSELREDIGWRSFPKERTRKALANDLYDVVVFDGDKAIGMGRLVGDGILYFYIQDVVVRKDYQGQGIGTQVLKQLLAYVISILSEGEDCSVGLIAAQGKEPFYEQFGFTALPDATSGAGMFIRMKKE